MTIKRLLIIKLLLFLQGASFTLFHTVTGESISTSNNNDAVAPTANTLGQQNNATTTTCDMTADGTCIFEDGRTTPIPPLPSPDEQGYVETGYGVKQHIVFDNPQAEQAQQRLLETHKYMYGDVYQNQPGTLRQDCTNQHESCTFWAAIGECTANPGYMEINCAPTCYTCHKLLFENRCPIPDNIEETNVWHAGDLNRMFDNIISNPYYTQQYGPIDVILRPGMKPPTAKNYNYDDSPWVVVIDNFISPDECESLIELGAKRGYEISKDVGARKFDGTYDSKQSSGRTSTNAWCVEECYNHTTTQQVIAKIENLTGIPDSNSEHLQLLRYDVGQFYEQHHDYIDFHLKRKQGVRMITVFLYLNDVEAGMYNNNK